MHRKIMLTTVLVAGALALALGGCTKKSKDEHYEGKVKANDPEAMPAGHAKGDLGGSGSARPGARIPRPRSGGGKALASTGKNPRVVIKTSLGNITVELFADKAPISTANFLRYATAKFYDGTIFHRVIPNFMIQGGGLTANMQKKPTRAPIRNEAKNGLSNVRGTLAMARTSNPDSATAQFFINVKDNPHLNHRGPGRGYGYAVFAKVVAGQAVVEKIRNTPTSSASGRPNVPTKPVHILQVRRQK